MEAPSDPLNAPELEVTGNIIPDLFIDHIPLVDHFVLVGGSGTL
jgi:hypothetical protein